MNNLQFYQKDQYFQGPKDQIIYSLQNEIYELKSKIGNYDILRKNMIDLELRYRDMVVNKASTEDKFRNELGGTMRSNTDMRSQIENLKEQVHLL